MDMKYGNESNSLHNKDFRDSITNKTINDDCFCIFLERNKFTTFKIKNIFLDVAITR